MEWTTSLLDISYFKAILYVIFLYFSQVFKKTLELLHESTYSHKIRLRVRPPSTFVSNILRIHILPLGKGWGQKETSQK